MIINEAMAKQFWPKGDPLTDRLVIGRGVMREFAAEPERQIIGIVADIRDGGLDSDPRPQMFIPQAQVPDAANALERRLTPISWVVRTAGRAAVAERGDPGAAAPGDRPAGVRRAIDGRHRVALDVAQKFNMWLMTVFGGSRAAARGDRHLRADGLLGRAAHAGDRHPPGARRAGAQVKNMVVFQGMRLALVGVVIGVLAAFGLARFIASSCSASRRRIRSSSRACRCC